MVAALDRMVDRGHRPALRVVPARGREVQPRQFVGPFARQLRAQEIGEQAVVAPGRRVAGHGREEQVGRGQLVEDGGAVDARVQGLADRGVELAQDAGAQQKVADLARLVREHVLGQVVGHRAVRAREALDEAGFEAVPLQRHRGQPDRRHPALGLAVQLRQHVGRQCLARALAEEGAGLVDVEAQPVGVDLHQLAARAQPAHAQVGQAARADHDAAAARQVVDDLAHQAQHRGLLHHLEVVEEQREGRVVRGQRGHRVEGRVGRRLVHAQALHRLAQADQEARDVVVGPVEREPGGGHAVGLHALAALRHGRGLAEARGRAHQDQLHRRRRDLFADRGAQHLRDDHGRRVELGFQDAGRGGGHCGWLEEEGKGGSGPRARARRAGQRCCSGLSPRVLSPWAQRFGRAPRGTHCGGHPGEEFPSLPTISRFDSAF